MLCRNLSVRSLLAAAGLVAVVHTASPTALGQEANTVGTDAPVSAPSGSALLDHAADLLAGSKVVQARSILVGLSTRDGGASLSDRERERLFQLLGNANRRLKSLSALEVSLQTAEEGLTRNDLRTVDRHAQAVIASPKATNQQVALAQTLFDRSAQKRAGLAPLVADTITQAVADFEAGRYPQAKGSLDAVYRSAAPLTSEQEELVLRHQLAIVEIESKQGHLFATDDAAAGMFQPGVVKKRQPEPPPAPPAAEPTAPPSSEPVALPESNEQPAQAQPAVAPAAESAPTQPASDPVEQARRWEAQSLMAEADQAYADGRMKEASTRYQRLITEYAPLLTAEQLTLAQNRRAEAQVQLGGPEANLLAGEIDARNRARQNTLAEFNNDLEQARRALTTGDPGQARDLAASANLRINTNRNLFSEAQFEQYAGQVRELLTEIDAASESQRIQSIEVRERTLKEDADRRARETATDRTRRIDEAIDRVRALQKSLEYEEALQVVDQILFLDRTNPTGLVLKDVLTDVMIYRKYSQIQRSKHLSHANQELENQDATIAPDNLLDYPTDWPRITYQRGEPIAYAEAEENRRTLAALESKRIPTTFQDTPFSSVLGFLATVTQLNMDIDWQSLEQVGIDPEAGVTLQLTNVPVKTVLERVLEKVSPDPQNGAAYMINDGVLTIASREVINKNTTLYIYDIRDLLIEVPDYANAPDFDLQTVLQGAGQGGGGGGQSPFQENEEEEPPRRTLEERTTDIIDIITTNVDSQGWQENGGDVGFIQQLAGSLIITNTPANHREIHGLLSKLREVRAMQINVETRFLLVSQDFFEQIGFDLDVYFNAQNNQVRAARAALPGNAVRAGDFFDFTRGGLQRRVFGAPVDADGDGTNDPQPGIPVVDPDPTSVIGASQNSLGLAESLLGTTFGADVLAGAPALGVAGQFLDDIQVDFLIKATQADRRTVALTAPRLTFTNGQTSNIYVATQVAFVSDLTPIVSESAVGFDPQLATVNEGVRLLVEGTISADRRYVTMNVDASVAKIEGFENTAVSAIAGGQLVNSAATQSFIQRPTVTVTRVQTTVTVPDQGTILLGGQRLVIESEVESGVPVLSKIPIINRFFSNRITTKEEQTLLILIKPTILIQNEEEERNFPGLSDSARNPFGG